MASPCPVPRTIGFLWFRITFWLVQLASVHSLVTDRIENTVSNRCSIVACVIVGAVTRWCSLNSTIECRPWGNLAMDISFRSRILAFSPHVTIINNKFVVYISQLRAFWKLDVMTTDISEIIVIHKLRNCLE
jgi:hypothetical protein